MKKQRKGKKLNIYYRIKSPKGRVQGKTNSNYEFEEGRLSWSVKKDAATPDRWDKTR